MFVNKYSSVDSAPLLLRYSINIATKETFKGISKGILFFVILTFR